MFDLEKEIAAWSAKVHQGRCRPEAEIAELQDHLHCEIERGRTRGLTEEAAFRAALVRLGEAPALAAEHAKNRSLLAAGCALAARLDRYDGPPLDRRQHRLVLAHAVVWASLILASSWLLSSSATPDKLALLLIGVQLPCWWACEQILRRSFLPKPPAGG